jgi:isopropylmalate/homocitrate/citramalate synthase
MKAYVLSPDALADEAARLQDMGVDMVTIMDSAGTMMPDEVSCYVEKMVRRVDIPVGFHGHNNLGLSVSNAIAAFREGASIIDCGLMGMARSAGNLATEIAVAVFDRLGIRTADLNSLLRFIDEKLAPAMEKHGYKPPVVPLDLVFGLAGCHSSNTAALLEASKEFGVDVFLLTMSVSAENRKNPSKDLIREHAHKLAAGVLATCD